jgi:hypothetical protein
MTRRSWFSAICGLPAAAAQVPEVAPDKHLPPIPDCRCGHTMMLVKSWEEADAYIACPNPRCALYRRPFARPTVALLPADPTVVRRVDRAIEQENAEAAKIVRTTARYPVEHYGMSVAVSLDALYSDSPMLARLRALGNTAPR